MSGIARVRKIGVAITETTSTDVKSGEGRCSFEASRSAIFHISVGYLLVFHCRHEKVRSRSRSMLSKE